MEIKENKQAWQSGMAKSITFIVTKDCQLACKYCYLVGKNEKERMSWETAKAAIDYILDHENDEMFDTESVIFDFIDGTRRKHDLNRVWKHSNGEAERGSYDDVVRNIPLWLSQFPDGGTKVTISSADIPYICESVLHLYSLGIHEVNINCVFEDVWHDGDDDAFEQQLMQLADAIIDGGYYTDYACSFFNEYIGKPMDPERDNQNWCGAGRMLSIDAAGNFYPCTRFAQYSLRSKKAWLIGNIRDGIDKNRLRPFLTLDRLTQSPRECIDCEVASGCAWCQGENYDAADTPTIYQRATAICKMHKARVRANNYYWNKLYRKLELEGNREEYEKNKPAMKPATC